MKTIATIVKKFSPETFPIAVNATKASAKITKTNFVADFVQPNIFWKIME